MKLFYKRALMGLLIFALAAAAGYGSYRLTMRYCMEQLAKETMVSAAATPQTHTEAPATDRETIHATYYTVRLENGKISVYAVNDENESFLYHLNTRTESLSPEDKSMLEQGIRLSDRKALASFEEDFTN